MNYHMVLMLMYTWFCFTHVTHYASHVFTWGHIKSKGRCFYSSTRNCFISWVLYFHIRNVAAFIYFFKNIFYAFVCLFICLSHDVTCIYLWPHRTHIIPCEKCETYLKSNNKWAIFIWLSGHAWTVSYTLQRVANDEDKAKIICG